MNNDSSAIVPKVWNYAQVLKNAGLGGANQVHSRHTLENLGTPLTKPIQKAILSRS